MPHIVMESPLGPLILTEERGALCSIDWSGSIPPGPGQMTPVLSFAKTQLEEYFAGQRKIFSFPYHLSGTAFQKDIYLALLQVPYGEKVTYGELAARSGHPGAARAVGQAMHKNPLPILIPCHRVCSKEKPLLFSGGEGRKRLLLDLENIPID